MDREAWHAAVHEVTKSRTWLSSWTELNCCCLVHKSCPTFCDPMNCSPIGSPVHGISQERILEWVSISFSKGSAWTRNQTLISCIGRWILYPWATREAQHQCVHIWKIPGLGKSPGDEKGYLLQYSVLENSMEHIVQGITKSQTWLCLTESDTTFTSLHFFRNLKRDSNIWYKIEWINSRIYGYSWNFNTPLSVIDKLNQVKSAAYSWHEKNY